MLNFNDVGRPLCRIVGGKYDKKVISVSDKFSSMDDDTLIKEFRQLKIPNDAKLQHIPDTTKERERERDHIHDWSQRIGQINLHKEVSRAVEEEEQGQGDIYVQFLA